MQVSPQRHDRLRRRRRAARLLAARRAAEAATTTKTPGTPGTPGTPEVKTTEPSRKGTVVTVQPKVPAQRSPVRPGTLGKSQPAVDRP